jgi:DNA-binding PadR family transcriptional regulator
MISDGKKYINNYIILLLTILCDTLYNLIEGDDLMSELENILQNIQQEMRRGTLILAVLTRMDEPQYGYSLIQSLMEMGISVDQNTLYPLLRRLEKQGLLESLWEVEENRPRRYYKISELGTEVRASLIKDWTTLTDSMSKLTGGLK